MPSPLRYGIAAAAALVATGVRLALNPWIGDQFPFLTFFAAVVFAAWLGGFGPSLLTLVLSGVAAVLFILPPGAQSVRGGEAQAGLAVFVLSGLGIALMGRGMRAARSRAEESERRVRGRLEDEHELRGRFETTLRCLGDAVLTTDAAGRVVSLNPVAEGLTGWTKDEAAGRPVGEVFRAVDAATGEPVETSVARVLREGRVVEQAGTTSLLARDGTSRPVDDNAAPIRGEDGGVRGVVLVFRDVTTRRRSEATIEEQVRLARYGRDVVLALSRSASLREMLELCAAATVRHLDAAFARVWTVDESGGTLELQASAGMYTHIDGPHGRIPVGKYKIGQIAGERRPILTNAVIGDPNVPAQEWAVREGMVAFAGYPLVIDDRLVGVLAMFARHSLSDATIQRMASVADEVAVGIERKRAEERLHRQREWLRVTLASVGDAVIATDTGGRVTFLNPVAEALTGWPSAAAVGAELGEVFRLVDETTRRPAESPAARALREGAVVGLANHTVLIARDGTERAIDDSAAPIRDEAGHVMGAVLIFRDVDAKRRDERALAASEARKAAVLETALDAIVSIDHRGKVLEWNPSAEQTFGYSKAEALGRELATLVIPPAFREAHTLGLARYLETGEGRILGRRFEITAVRADGTEFPIELAVNRIPTDGPPVFTAHLRDITGRKQAEGRLLEQTRIAETLHRIGGLMAAELDLKRLVQVVTDEATRLTDAQFGAFFYNAVDERGETYTLYTVSGVPDGAFAGMPVPRNTGLFGPTFRGEGVVRLDDVTADPRFGHNGPYFGTPGGHLPVRSYLAVPVTSRSGDVLGGLFFGHAEAGVFTGAAERIVVGVAAQAAVAIDNARLFREAQASEQRFRELSDAMPQIVWGADPDGRLDYCNRRWEEFTGRASCEGEENGWRSVLHPDDVRPSFERWGAAIATGEPYQTEHRFWDRNRGEYRWFLDRALPVRNAAGAVVRWYGTCTDIDDQKRAEGALREADRRKNEFLATLAHELRNPLAPVRNALRLMKPTAGNGEAPVAGGEHEALRVMMERQVLNMSRLVEDLLDVSRIDSGKIELRKQAVDLVGVARHAVDAGRPFLESRQHELVVSLPDSAIPVEADPTRLEQILDNLLTNAAKYTDPGGRVWLTVGREGDTAVVRLRDTGIGIEPAMLARVFDLFVQADRRTDLAQGGLGIGLSLVKSLVELHGGTIHAHSEGRGQGTEFVVRLPVFKAADATDGGAPPAAGPAEAGRPARRKILVVDDNQDAADSLARILTRLYKQDVRVAYDGPSALEAAATFRPEVVLLDIGLPGMDGYEVARRLREAPGLHNALLVAVTGWGQEQDRKRSQEAGFHVHLVKPVEPDAVRDLLAEAVTPAADVGH